MSFAFTLAGTAEQCQQQLAAQQQAQARYSPADAMATHITELLAGLLAEWPGRPGDQGHLGAIIDASGHYDSQSSCSLNLTVRTYYLPPVQPEPDPGEDTATAEAQIPAEAASNG